MSSPTPTTIFAHLRSRLLAKAGLGSPPKPRFTKEQWKQLEQSEWSPTFERLMRNRLLMGALRYETFAEKRQLKTQYDLLGAIEHKLDLYRVTGNTECLVDIANYAMIEFECGSHPNKHFRALDDHNEHCKKKGPLNV